MKELIYMWIESVKDRAQIEKQGIALSDNYSVEFSRDAKGLR